MKRRDSIFWNTRQLTDLSGMFSGIPADTITTLDECMSKDFCCSPAGWEDVIDRAPAQRDIIYIHKTNCPNCNGLLDGDEHSPYVKCACCGAKIWSEREVS